MDTLNTENEQEKAVKVTAVVKDSFKANIKNSIAKNKKLDNNFKFKQGNNKSSKNMTIQNRRSGR